MHLENFDWATKFRKTFKLNCRFGLSNYSTFIWLIKLMDMWNWYNANQLTWKNKMNKKPSRFEFSFLITQCCHQQPAENKRPYLANGKVVRQINNGILAEVMLLYRPLAFFKVWAGCCIFIFVLFIYLCWCNHSWILP